MEEGSLLTEALRQQRQQQHLLQSSSEGHNFDKNAIVLDVFSLNLQDIKGEDCHIQRLLHLAELASLCNQLLKSWNVSYKWHFGGCGPAFGVHLTDGIPHLRALVRYGPNVLDEWVAVDYMLKLSKHMAETTYEIAISCWDLEDGQLILIQTADVLPDWMDEDATDRHRHACWMRHGQVIFLSESHVTLQDALLKVRKSSASPTDRAIQGALDSWLEGIREQSQLAQRTPLVVPRKVAWLIQKRPDLVHACLQSFCQNIERPVPDVLANEYDDWVWVTTTLSRTNYAMVRSMVSPTWDSPEFIPPNMGMEVKRFKRQCAIEATPHVRHALQLGVRLVTGLHFMTQGKDSETSSVPSSLERRIAHWSRISTESTGWSTSDSNSNKSTSAWLLQAVQQGPHHAAYNLEHLLKCPVFPEEYGNLTLLTHPETSLRQQLLQAQKVPTSPEADGEFILPRGEDVDDDAWMFLEGSGGSPPQGNSSDLDGMLARFQNFMVQPSGAEGVASSSAAPVTEPTGANPKAPGRREIRPRIFMNILHAVLKGTDLTFPTTDPYFFQDDYDFMDDADGDENDDGEDDDAMKNLMNAMDEELRGSALSRDLDATPGMESGGNDVDGGVAEGAHVLSNLLQSLEAGSGTPGPVPNMLQEMNGSGGS